MRRLRQADFRAMPWRNGKGVTTELWRENDAAGDMLWRVSIAGVTESGPFSAFPGYQRHILTLTGDGMELDGGPNGTIRVGAAFTPCSFSGDWPISARLLGTPLKDFNLMIRRDWGAGTLAVWDDAGVGTVPRRLPDGTRLLWLHAGEARLGSMTFVAEEACLLEPDEDFTLVTSPGTRVILCVVQPAR